MNDMKKTMVILAAGVGSRFGEGIKQLEPVGPRGEIIMDYSIHDAIKAGFNKIIFIIRKDIETDFKERIGSRIEKICHPINVEISYAYQEKDDLPSGFDFPKREKPWGTGHAVLACKGMIGGPFAVINADDYYGKEGFIKAGDFLDSLDSLESMNPRNPSKPRYALIGYILKNTLSDKGGVSRGICETVIGGSRPKLIGIDETKNIIKSIDPATGRISASSNGRKIDADSLVSMNFWCYPPEFIDILERGFPEFLSNMKDPDTDEYLLPMVVDDMLKHGTEVAVIPTNDEWLGVTYKEDKGSVIEGFRKLYSDHVYNENLYSDIQSGEKGTIP